MANNNYPQITSVTSESLQAQIRALLPSQEGFGTDLMAQNVIVPVIDLTSAAEGSSVPENLQTALAFGSQTVFSANNNTAVIANSTGFWRIFAVSTMTNLGSSRVNTIQMSDGLSTKNIWQNNKSASEAYNSLNLDFVVFLGAGESISAITDSGDNFISGSVRQIADVNGTLVNPSGFNPQ